MSMSPEDRVDKWFRLSIAGWYLENPNDCPYPEAIRTKIFALIKVTKKHAPNRGRARWEMEVSIEGVDIPKFWKDNNWFTVREERGYLYWGEDLPDGIPGAADWTYAVWQTYEGEAEGGGEEEEEKKEQRRRRVPNTRPGTSRAQQGDDTDGSDVSDDDDDDELPELEEMEEMTAQLHSEYEKFYNSGVGGTRGVGEVWTPVVKLSQVDSSAPSDLLEPFPTADFAIPQGQPTNREVFLQKFGSLDSFPELFMVIARDAIDLTVEHTSRRLRERNSKEVTFGEMTQVGSTTRRYA